MQAYGFIETKGILAAIESLDIMLKAAEVKLVTKEIVGGGIVTIIIKGDVGAVKAAVEAGIIGVESLGKEFLLSSHIIARPDKEIENILLIKDKIEIMKENVVEESINFSKEDSFDYEEKSTVKDGVLESQEIKEENTLRSKEEIDVLVKEKGFEFVVKELEKLKVVELRVLVKKYKEIIRKNKKILKANKNLLLQELENYYSGVQK